MRFGPRRYPRAEGVIFWGGMIAGVIGLLVILGAFLYAPLDEPEVATEQIVPNIPTLPQGNGHTALTIRSPGTGTLDGVAIRGDWDQGINIEDTQSVDLKDVEIDRTSPSDPHLSRAQKIALSDELKRLGWQPENVTLRYFNGCMECLRYAADFSEALKWAGWEGRSDATFDANPELTGIQIVVESLSAKPRDAAIDNAEAAPDPNAPASLVRHDFHSGSAEVERLRMSIEQVLKLLSREIEERERAAAELDRLGQADAADALRAEIGMAKRYVEDPGRTS